MSKGRTSKRERSRRLIIRGVRRQEVDLAKLGRALLAIALAQAELERAAAESLRSEEAS